MFNEMKEQMLSEQATLDKTNMLLEMAVEGGSEDEFIEGLEDGPLSAEEAKKVEELLAKIPEYELDKAPITKDDIEEADKAIGEPSIEEMVEELGE